MTLTNKQVINSDVGDIVSDTEEVIYKTQSDTVAATTHDTGIITIYQVADDKGADDTAIRADAVVLWAHELREIYEAYEHG